MTTNMNTRTNADDHQPQSFFRHNARYFFALAFFLLFLQDVFGTHGLVAMHRSKNQIQRVETQISQLDHENQQLQQRIHSLKTDPAAIEKIARDRMGLARPGEMIFQTRGFGPQSQKLIFKTQSEWY